MKEKQASYLFQILNGTKQTFSFCEGGVGAYQGRMRPKEDQTSAGKSANPAASCPAYRAL